VLMSNQGFSYSEAASCVTGAKNERKINAPTATASPLHIAIPRNMLYTLPAHVRLPRKPRPRFCSKLHLDAPFFSKDNTRTTGLQAPPVFPILALFSLGACAIFREVREDDYLRSHDGGFQ
jgi:hypothetical protein